MSHERLRHTLALLLPVSPSLPKLDILTPRFWQVGAADALEIVHQGQRIVHGEIRGDSFHMNTETGHVKLTVASGSGLRTFEHGLTSTGWSTLSKEVGAMTKLSYIAPEQTGRFNAQEDSRTDIYSLGIVLWTLLAQKSPFDGETPMDVMRGILNRRIPMVSSFRMDVPDAIARVIQKMTAKTISDRYQSVGGLRQDFLEINTLLEAGSAAALQDFKIATKDFSSFFVLPPTIVGREQEYNEILKVIHRVSEQHTSMQRQDVYSLSSDASISDGRLASFEQELASEDSSSIGGKTNRSSSEVQIGDVRPDKPKPTPLQTSVEPGLNAVGDLDLSMRSDSKSIPSSSAKPLGMVNPASQEGAL